MQPPYDVRPPVSLFASVIGQRSPILTAAHSMIMASVQRILVFILHPLFFLILSSFPSAALAFPMRIFTSYQVITTAVSWYLATKVSEVFHVPNLFILDHDPGSFIPFFHHHDLSFFWVDCELHLCRLIQTSVCWIFHTSAPSTGQQGSTLMRWMGDLVLNNIHSLEMLDIVQQGSITHEI